MGSFAPSKREGGLGRPLRILSVEDDMLVAMGTTGMLEDLGHQVTEAASAEQALRLLEKGLRVDILITDQGMAGLSGIQLAEAAQRLGSIPVLLVTGYLDLVPQPGLEVLVLHKPFRTSDLDDAILRTLQSHAAAAAPLARAAD